MKKYLLLYLFYSFFNISLKAQQPSHYFLGEDELSGVDIYSIIQDKESNIWLSTNNGLIKYDGYSFSSIKYKSPKSNSLFGLTKDNFEDLYCCNLSGQIFKVYDDSLFLFFEIPDSLLSKLVHFNFDNKNRLVFCTDNYYLVDNDSNIKFLFPSEYSSNRIAKTKQNELILLSPLSKEIAFYKNDTISSRKQLDFVVSYPYITDNKIYLTTPHYPNVYSYNNNNWSKIDFEELERASEFYPLNDSLLIFTFKNNGISFYNNKGSLKYKKPQLFSKHRISCVLNDKEGNLWLPTLGKGIIIIPNTEIIDYNNHPLLKEDDIKAITSDNDGVIYTAGLNGSIYKIKNQAVEIIKDQNIEIEFLKYKKNDNSLIYNNINYSLTTKKEISLNISSTKDISIGDSNDIYLATNGGLYHAYRNKSNFNKNELKLLSKNRTSCVAYDKKRKEVWAGTTKGLLYISDNDHKFILYNNQQISVTDIEYIKSEIWVSTLNNGILIFNNGVFSQSFKNTSQKTIYDLTYINSKLYFTSEIGLHIYDFETKKTVNISKTDGLLSNKIIDFEVINEEIWFVFPNGLQQINSEKIFENKIPPSLKWKSLLVNNKPYDIKKSNQFNYLQNQLEFRFVASAFRHRGKLTYKYLLEGLNDNWQETSHTNNIAAFSSLPHGNYTLKVKAINENGIESSTISYSFSISPPFWLTWWFFLLCALTLIIIVASYFIVRINIIKKRLTFEKRLKTSEITAIKAQMNPHFMFNALNSIQDLIMLKDIKSSNIYLGKFADLMRKTLEFSSKNFITLTDEIEILNLYLELEKLRFGDDFIAKINLDFSNEKLHEIQIPSMLLQPYIENAIRHGLLHKKGQKELTVTFKLKDTTLVCEILDNGIGRKKSTEIKERRKKSYPSFSSDANQKRIDLIRESTDKKVSLEIIDLYENNIAIGTKVIFEFE